MMKLNSARMAWHDSLYIRRDSQGATMQEIGTLGRMVQKTERGATAGHAAHQAVAGRIQQAMDTLPPHLKAFGNWMYSPMANADEKEEAEELVFMAAYNAGQKMYAKKFGKARRVAAGVLFRYRRMHQGGQSEGIDPCPSPEAFRAWLDDTYGLELSSEQWSREWGGFIEACFAACNDFDKAALVPISNALKIMKMAA